MNKSENSLCWSCGRPGTGTCSWDKKLKPVKGWNAERHVYHNYHNSGKDSYTYHVIDCPEFLEDRKIKLEETDRAILELLKRGKRTMEISRELGVSHQRVSYRKAKFIKSGLL